VTLRREVPLSPRPHIRGPMGERHPARRHRVARLSFAATTVELKRTSDARKSPSATLCLNVIHVFERKPPPGQPAVEWFLLTNLPIDNDQAIAFAVDCYRARWTIEICHAQCAPCHSFMHEQSVSSGTATRTWGPSVARAAS
jgi:hypothetical protein